MIAPSAVLQHARVQDRMDVAMNGVQSGQPGALLPGSPVKTRTISQRFVVITSNSSSGVSKAIALFFPGKSVSHALADGGAVSDGRALRSPWRIPFVNFAPEIGLQLVQVDKPVGRLAALDVPAVAFARPRCCTEARIRHGWETRHDGIRHPPRHGEMIVLFSIFRFPSTPTSTPRADLGAYGTAGRDGCAWPRRPAAQDSSD
jgi:hypothetical protein